MGGVSAPRAAVVDLDDTLYPQAAFLEGAAAAVTARAGELGLPAAAFHRAFLGELARGSDRGRTIDRALEAVGATGPTVADLVAPLVESFQGFRPARLEAYPGVPEALRALREVLPLACLTDGAPAGQRSKLKALRLTDAFDAVVITDELGGRAARKPAIAGLQRAAALLGARPEEVVVIGDRPDKDVVMALTGGAWPVRVRQGEYATCDDAGLSCSSVSSFPEAVAEVLAAVIAGGATRRTVTLDR